MREPRRAAARVCGGPCCLLSGGGAPDIVQRPVVRTQTVRPQAQRVVYREEAPQRSWKKTALVIGGTAGAGAGIGALAGGKKGALIGAAIGGGGASIYEAIKRK